jgi:hypothetical protein
MIESVPEQFPSEEVGEHNRDALGRIEAEITEMNAVGFDDTCFRNPLTCDTN